MHRRPYALDNNSEQVLISLGYDDVLDDPVWPTANWTVAQGNINC